MPGSAVIGTPRPAPNGSGFPNGRTGRDPGFAALPAFALCVVLSLAACDRAPPNNRVEPDLANRAYSGLPGLPGPIELQNGRWSGEPYQPGAASRPSVTLLPDFAVRGDLGGDGRPDVAAVLALAGGGSGEYLYAAVVSATGSEWTQTALAPLGDRVQLRAGRMDGGVLLLDVVEAGPGDAACCPGRVVTRGWRLATGGEMEEFEPGLPESRLDWTLLAGSTWTLRSWGQGDAVAEPLEITLDAALGAVSGSSGCNRYRGGVEDGASPGEIAIGTLAVTRMACPETLMANERRYLDQVRRAVKFGFFGGRLALSYRDAERGWDRMLFVRRTQPVVVQ
jgi:heat shock protein HslJ